MNTLHTPQTRIDTLPEATSLVATEMQRRIFNLRKATQEEVKAVILKLQNTPYLSSSLNLELITFLATEPASTSSIDFASYYERIRGTRSTPFLNTINNFNAALNRHTDLRLHVQDQNGQAAAKKHGGRTKEKPAPTFFTLGTARRPLIVNNSVSDVTHQRHLALDQISQGDIPQEFRTTLQHFAHAYAAAPLEQLGTEAKQLIKSTNELLEPHDLEIHTGGEYGILGSAIPGFPLYLVDSTETRNQVAEQLSSANR